MSRERDLQKSISLWIVASNVCTYWKIIGKAVRQAVIATVLKTTATNATVRSDDDCCCAPSLHNCFLSHSYSPI